MICTTARGADSGSQSAHLADDVVRRFDPADENCRQQRNERHHDGVADIVHEVQQLTDRAVGQRQLKIELAVAQRNDGARRKIDHGQNNNRLFAVSMENFHTVCHDGFQHRNAGGQRRKNRREEEQGTHKSARFFLYEAAIV